MPERPEAYLTGLGHYLPERVVTNQELEKVLDTSDEWIRERTGIVTRHIIDDEMATSDMAVEAGRKALEAAEIDPMEVDLVLLATYTEDHPFPASACLVQERLGCGNAGAFDIESACTGWIAATSTGSMWIRGGGARTVLVIGSDATSRVLDWEDRSTAVLFGDGASAVVLQDRPGKNLSLKVLSTYLETDGSGAFHLHMPAGGSRKPASKKTVEAREHYIKMQGRATYKFAVKALADSVRTVCQRAEIRLQELSQIVPHQANARIIEGAAKRLELSPEDYYLNIDRYGNTVAASIGIALEEALAEGRIAPGQKAALVGMGAGLTWGGLAVEYEAPEDA